MSHPSRLLDLRRECLFIASPNDEFVRFDLAGRWFSAQRGNSAYRRGHDGRVVERVRAERGRGAPTPARILAAEEAAGLTATLHANAETTRRLAAEGVTEVVVRSGSRPDLEALLDRVASWTPERYAADAARFHAIFGDVPVLPADQYLALYLQPVTGCVYNRCRFCSLYRDVPHHVRTPDEWDEHCDAVAAYFGPALPLRHGIFLGDANALDAGADALVDRLHSLRARIALSPETLARGFFAFHDTFSGPSWTAANYARAAAAGLRRVYIGLESGDDGIRRAMAKPGAAAQVVERVRMLKEGGLSAGLMILVGAGGREHRDEHVRGTLELIERCELDRRDLVFLSHLEAPAETAWIDALPDEAAMAEEEAVFRAGLPPGVPVSRYEVEGFVY
jgi:hypothetical protein